jgi:hypothetical protein
MSREYRPTRKGEGSSPGAEALFRAFETGGVSSGWRSSLMFEPYHNRQDRPEKSRAGRAFSGISIGFSVFADPSLLRFLPGYPKKTGRL